MAKSVITADQWLDALAKAGMQDDDQGDTMREIADRTGKAERTVQCRMRQLLAEGLVIQGWAMRTDTIGRRQRVPVYRMKDET